MKVTAIGPDGKPVSALPLRMDMMVDGVALVNLTIRGAFIGVFASNSSDSDDVLLPTRIAAARGRIADALVEGERDRACRQRFGSAMPRQKS